MAMMTVEQPLQFAALGECDCGRSHEQPSRVVITGGPGAGKTAVLEIAARTFCKHVAVVPEAASIVFGGGFPRLATESGKRAAQMAIYHIQRQLELLAASENHFAVALCDRGTIDSEAYWPGTAESFWSALDTTSDEQRKRYAAVIHLRTPSIHHGYNHRNSLRTESAAEAAAIDRRIESAWAGHPNRVFISSELDFPTKATKSIEAIAELIPACCRGAP